MFGFTFVRSQQAKSVGYAANRPAPFAKAMAAGASEEGQALKC